MGATHTLARIAASVGGLTQVEVAFSAAESVENGGVLLAVPALLATGLLRHATDYFQLPKGYYGLESIFLLLSMMALARVPSVEALRYEPPGEWGKLLGLDRIPEARTLRQKIAHLVDQDVQAWSGELCSEWIQCEPESCGTFYIDGHARVYHGSQTNLPKHYVARQKLCLRATVDYWVNDGLGAPFFHTHPPADPGLLTVLQEDIVPRLQAELVAMRNEVATGSRLETVGARPMGQPAFSIVFDREGYSPEFFASMRNKQIACFTYHKYPGPPWPVEEFVSVPVTLCHGEVVTMELAERGSLVGSGPSLWMREIRRRHESGHQTSVITTHEGLAAEEIASRMFARWSQENFFRYMKQQFGLDKLLTQCLEDIPGDTKVVNPAYRAVDGEVRKKVAHLSRALAKLAAIAFTKDVSPQNAALYERKKADAKQHADTLTSDVQTLKERRKNTPKHLLFNELPKEQQWQRLAVDSKHFLDTIKMIAYRAETAMAGILRESLARTNDARSLLRAIYQNTADLVPDHVANTLEVRLHHLASHLETNAMQHLCDQLNETQTTFPGTKLVLRYVLGSPENL